MSDEELIRISSHEAEYESRLAFFKAKQAEVAKMEEGRDRNDRGVKLRPRKGA